MNNMNTIFKKMLAFFCSAMVFISCTQQSVTSYPIMGLASLDPGINDSMPSYKEVINPIEISYYTVSHGGAVNLVRDIADANNYKTKAVVYTGGFTVQTQYVPTVEEKYRAAIAMSPLATLALDIDENVSILRLDMGEDKEWPFHASTANVSSGKGDNKYCFWIRVGDEFMKVLATNPQGKTLTLERGFDNTTSSAHSKGNLVFGPVYLGNRNRLGRNARSSNAWPTSQEGIRYALDPANLLTHQLKADFVIEKVNEGFAGIWWDTFQPFTYNLCDPLGRGGYGKDGVSLTYWDFMNNQPYTPESLREAMKSQIRGVRELTRQATGINPYLTANNISKKYEFLKSTIEPDILLDGFCFEDAFISPLWESEITGDTRNDRRKINFTFRPLKQVDWETKINEMIQAAKDGKETYSMIGPAGYVLAYFNPSQPNFESLGRFGWSSFLLTVEESRTTSFGLPITFTRNKEDKWEIIPLADYYFYPIGNPVESKSLKEYQVNQSSVWMRRFENGIAIVSRMDDGQQMEVVLPGMYKNPQTGEKINSITITGTDGIVLVKK